MNKTTDWKIKIKDRNLTSISLKKHGIPFVRIYTKVDNIFHYEAVYCDVKLYQYDISEDTLFDILESLNENEFTVVIRR